MRHDRLNVFQKLMLQWERFAPYNAAQVMTLRGQIAREPIESAWRAARATIAAAVPTSGLSDATDAVIDRSGLTLSRHLADELNRRFADDADPLRPFVQHLKHEGDLTRLGLVYRHMLADSVSIRLLMKRWFDAVVGRDPGDGVLKIDGRRRSLWGLGLRQPLVFAKEAIAEVKRMRLMKQVDRLRGPVDLRSSVGFERVELADGLLPELLAAARSLGAKLNDMLVAAAAMACRDVVPTERRRRRTRTAVGTIVDVRKASDTTFGVSLGFVQAVFDADQLCDVRTAVSAAAAQSRQARRTDAASRSILRIAAAELLGQRMSDQTLAEFYRKRCPLVAGISNVNLDRDWVSAEWPDRLIDYTRASPLGPMVPIVFTPTTLGGRMHLCVSWRESVIRRELASDLSKRFVTILMSMG